MSKAWDKSKLLDSKKMTQGIYYGKYQTNCMPTRDDDFETLLNKIEYYEENQDKFKDLGTDLTGRRRVAYHPLEIIINYHKEIFGEYNIAYGSFIIKLKTKKPSLYLKHKDVLEPPLKREIKRRKMVKNIWIIIALIIVIFFLVFMVFNPYYKF